jgi:hypothetical protein
MRVFPVEMRAQFPELPLASTQNFTMAMSPGLFLVTGNRENNQEIPTDEPLYW